MNTTYDYEPSPCTRCLGSSLVDWPLNDPSLPVIPHSPVEAATANLWTLTCGRCRGIGYEYVKKEKKGG